MIEGANSIHKPNLSRSLALTALTIQCSVDQKVVYDCSPIFQPRDSRGIPESSISTAFSDLQAQGREVQTQEPHQAQLPASSNPVEILVSICNSLNAMRIGGNGSPRSTLYSMGGEIGAGFCHVTWRHAPAESQPLRIPWDDLLCFELGPIGRKGSHVIRSICSGTSDPSHLDVAHVDVEDGRGLQSIPLPSCPVLRFLSGLRLLLHKPF